MRPRPLTILLLLLAGAVVNVGVAWGCAMWSPAVRVEMSAEQEDLAVRALGVGYRRYFAAEQTAGFGLLVSRIQVWEVGWGIPLIGGG